MVCALVQLLLKENVRVLFGVLRSSRSNTPFLAFLWFCIVVISNCFLSAAFWGSVDHVDLMPSEDGQLTETSKGDTYPQIESHWTVLIIIL
jgi:hypothetical protein